MPVVILLGSVIAGGVFAHFFGRKLVSMLPSWATAGDAIPNRLTQSLLTSGGAGGGDVPSPLQDLANTLHAGSSIPAGLAVAAAGVSHMGNPVPVASPGVTSSPSPTSVSGTSSGGPGVGITSGGYVAPTAPGGGGGSFTP